MGSKTVASISVPTCAVDREVHAGALGHPPVIYKDLVIFAGRTGENLPVAPGPDARLRRADGQAAVDVQHGSASGRVRIRHVAEGCLDLIGNVRLSWQGMSLDEQRGIVYVATANPVNMFIGRDWLGDNLFGNTLLALDAETGKRIGTSRR